MISIQGYWYDGRTSAQLQAVLYVYDNGAIRVEGTDDGRELISISGFNFKVSPRLADTPRFLYFATGEKFETDDNDTVDIIIDRFKSRPFFNFVHKLESHKRYILLCLIAMLLLAWLTGKYAVPATAELIAFKLPYSIYRHAGKETLKLMDQVMFKPSQLDDQEKTRLVKHFRSLIEDHQEYELRILFRKGGQMGPNALALPCGTIIFTDEMVQIAEDNDELLAILAHETGHVVHRHGLRILIQDSLFAFALLAITGDASGTSELFLALPAILTELAYSRGFERDADQYALEYLKSRDILACNFANILRRIEQQNKLKSESGAGKLLNYLSTHPLTEERLQIFDNCR